eukprot:321616_1
MYLSIFWLFIVSNRSTDSNNSGNIFTELEQNINPSRKLLTDHEWKISDVIMPLYNTEMAVGSYGNSIYLLGGKHPQQVTRYDIVTNEMFEIGEYKLPSHVFGSGQFYSIFNNIMYIVDGTDNTLSTYNLRTESFTQYWNNIRIPSKVGIGSCIVVTNAFLFVVGGYNYVDNVYNALQILSLERYPYTWIPNPPPMIKSRNYLTCNIINDILYAIGGYDQIDQNKLEYLDTVEYIVVTQNDMYKSWKYMDARLLYPIESARSVVYKALILVIGGQYYEQYQTQHIVDVMQVINTDTFKITAGGILNEPVYNTAAIIVNDIIYAFGGNSFNSDMINQWQYCSLVRTQQPTKSPTSLPTNTPTNYPSNAPTKSVNEATSDTVLIALAIITIIVILCVSIICWKRIKYQYRIFHSKQLFKSIKIPSKSIKNDDKYNNMITIDENQE